MQKSEKKWRLNVQRLESRIQELEAREKQLRDEARFLEQERLGHMEEKERWERERVSLLRACSSDSRKEEEKENRRARDAIAEKTEAKTEAARHHAEHIGWKNRHINRS